MEREIVTVLPFPTEFNVLVKMEMTPEKSKGGIILPDDNKERESAASARGMIIALSPLAFTYETWPDDKAKPRKGDRIVVAKYAGTKLEPDNKDEDYRLIKDKDILAYWRN